LEGDFDALGLSDGLLDPDSTPISISSTKPPVGLADGESDALGLLDGLFEGDFDALGLIDALGLREGDLLGLSEGLSKRMRTRTKFFMSELVSPDGTGSGIDV